MSTAAPELALSKSSTPTSVVIGNSILYTLRIKNVGTAPLPAGNVAFNDLLPTGVTLTSVTAVSGATGASCTGQTGLLTCSATTNTPLAVNSEIVVTLQTTAPTTAGGINNYASVTPDGTTPPTQPSPNCNLPQCAGATTNVRAPALTLTKSGPATAVAGSAYTYTLVLLNTGTASIPANGVIQVEDDLPAGAVYLSAAPGLGASGVTCSGTSYVTCGVQVANGLASGVS